MRAGWRRRDHFAGVSGACVGASAATIHGLVFDDADGDGRPSAGERGIAGAVEAVGEVLAEMRAAA